MGARPLTKRRTIRQRALVPVVAMAFNADGRILGKKPILLEARDGGHLHATGRVEIPIARTGFVARVAGYLPQFDIEVGFPLASPAPVRVKKGDTITLQLSTPAVMLSVEPMGRWTH